MLEQFKKQKMSIYINVKHSGTISKKVSCVLVLLLTYKGILKIVAKNQKIKLNIEKILAGNT